MTDELDVKALQGLVLKLKHARQMLQTASGHLNRPKGKWVALGFINDADRQLQELTGALEQVLRSAWGDM